MIGQGKRQFRFWGVAFIAATTLCICRMADALEGITLKGMEPRRSLSSSIESANSAWVGDPSAIAMGQRMQMDGLSSGSTVCTNETEATKEIQALARALQYDPKLIYEYVRNHIEYGPANYGVTYGARGCLLAGRGNDWDQACLLTSLLRTSGYNTRFVTSLSAYYTEDLAAWFGVSTNDVEGTLVLGGNDCLPTDVSGSYGMTRIWVEAEIDGMWYCFDPAYKEYSSVSGINLTNAMGYSRAQFMAGATNGATLGSNYVQKVNETNIASSLIRYTTNLVNFIQTSCPNASIAEVIGGRKLIEETLAGYESWTDYPPPAWDSYPDSRNEMDSIPDGNVLTVTIQHCGISNQFKGYQLIGRRLSITYNSNDSYRAQLRLDGSLIATGSTTTVNSTNTLIVSVDHPYPYLPWWGVINYADQSCQFSLISGGSYVVGWDSEHASPRFVEECSSALSAAIDSGLATNSEAVLCGGLQVALESGMEQSRLSRVLMWQVGGKLTYYQHFIGVMAQDKGYYIDLPGQYFTAIGTLGELGPGLKVAGGFGSALEHGLLEQRQGTNMTCASTVKLIQINNSLTNRTYLATSNNWTSVTNGLVNYSSALLGQIKTNYIDNGFVCVLPKDGSLHASGWTWSGAGYVAYKLDENGWSLSTMITGGYAGGYSGYQAVYNGNAVPQQVDYPQAGDGKHGSKSTEPVDLATGAYLVGHQDLKLGNDNRSGLALARLYNSDLREKKGTFGNGWTHGYAISAEAGSHGAPGLGTRLPKDAAPFIVYSLVARDVMRSDTNVTDWVCGLLASKWVMDQLTENIVNVTFGDRSMEYVKMPDGSYVPPPAETANLEKQGNAYVLKQRFGDEYLFNTTGKVSVIRDADTNTTTFVYDSATNLTLVTNSFGYSLTFAYSNNFVSSINDSAGRSVSYTYSASNLVTFTDAAGNNWSYAYQDTNWPHSITMLTDPLSRMTASNHYDSVGQVDSQMNGFGNLWQFYFSDFRNVEENPQGGQTVHFFDNNFRSLGVENAISNRTYAYYDGQGHVVSNMDARGFVTRFYYDGWHNMTNKVDALTNSTIFTFDSQYRLVATTNALGYSTRFAYDSEHHLTNTVDAMGNSRASTYYASGLPQTVTDPKGNTTTFTWDSHGNPQNIQRTDGGTVTNQYNNTGDLIAFTDANGKTSQFSYDKRRLLTSDTDPLGYIASNVYDAAALMIRAIDRNGNTNTYSYTPTYNISAVTNANGGRILKRYESRDWLSTVTDPNGNLTSNVYDSAGRVIAVVGALSHTTSFGYDPNGNLIALTNALGKVVSSAYDSLNRLISTLDPLGYTSTIEYDALSRVIATTDKKGYRTESEYDALNRKTAVVKPDATREQFRYDVVGNLTNFVNGEGAVRIWSYDGMSRVLSEQDPSGHITAFKYDSVGNLTNRVDGNGAATQYKYNSANNPTNVTYPNGTVTFKYNANRILTNMTDAVGTTRFTYNNMNWMATALDRHGTTVSYSYDLKGNRVTITYPGSLVVTNTFDALDRLVAVKDWNSKTTTYLYNNVNSLTNIAYPSGVNGRYTFDDAQRLTGFEYLTNGVAFVSRSLSRDEVGNLTAETINAGLEPVPQARVLCLAQDAADVLSQTLERTVPDDPSWTTNSYFFDSNGNMVSNSAGMVLRYDPENRLTNFISGTVTNRYEYDGLGDRTRRTLSGIGYQDVLDRGASLHNVLMSTYTNGTTIFYYVWGNGLIARIDTNGACYYYHPDGQGSTLALTDTNGVAVQQYAYSPYGEVLSSTGSIDTAYKWIGGYGVWSDGQSLYHMKARYYHAGVKRFITADPIGLAGGGNLYWYADGNPLVFIDVFGLCADGYFSAAPQTHVKPYEGAILPADPHPGTISYHEASFGQFPPDDPRAEMNAKVIQFGLSTAAGFGAFGKVAGAVKKGGTTVFRVVNDAEKAAIQNSGTFDFLSSSSTPTGEAGKFFWNSMDEAKRFQKYWYRAGEKSHVVSTTLGPNATPTLFPNTDGIGTAIWAPLEDLTAPIIFH